MTMTINYLIAEARKAGLTDGDWKCIEDARGILTETEIKGALEKFIKKSENGLRDNQKNRQKTKDLPLSLPVDL